MLQSKFVLPRYRTHLTYGSLRANPDLLTQVKEQLFKLWGDLEEEKSAMMKLQSTKADKELPASSFGSEFGSSLPTHKAGAMPDVDSDAENEPSLAKPGKKSKSSILQELDSNIGNIVAGDMEQSVTALVPKNKAFTCCIKQYGIKVDEDDPAKANSGPGKRWQRMFGLFDTYIQ